MWKRNTLKEQWKIINWKIITFENPILGVGIFEDSDGQFFNAETEK